MVTGWNDKPLLECVDLLQGLTYNPNNVRSHGLLVLRSSNIQNGNLAFDDCVYVDCIIDSEKYVQPNDILICVRNGSSALIGKSCVVDKPYNATFGAFMSVLRGDSTGYIAHMFSSDIVQSQIRNRSSATINQITKRDFEDIIVPVPNDETEQRRIAEALSDTDALIAALEKLIAKKRAVKQGAMQELLTGKRRLPGFSGEWVDKTIRDFATLVTKGTTPTSMGMSFTNAGITFVKIESIVNNRIVKRLCAFISEETNNTLSRSILQENDILISIAGALGRCAIVYPDILPANTNQALSIVRLDESSVCIDFIFKYLHSNIISQYIDEISVQGAQANLSLENIKDIPIWIPDDIVEQAAIATILSDMDTEIDALTAKLNKLRNIKNGMMSELLTGSIRLSVAEPSNQEKDSIAFAVIADCFCHPLYPLGRVKLHKLLYLLSRYQKRDMSGFVKNVAGPYNMSGGEELAVESGYITESEGDVGYIIGKGNNIAAALACAMEWNWQDAANWLVSNFQYSKREELEMLATVDMAACELQKTGKTVDLKSIKGIIHSHKDWIPKLSQPHFSDDNIVRAINWSIELFGQEVPANG